MLSLRNYAETIALGLDPVAGAPWYPHRSVKVLYAVDCGAGRVAVNAWQMYSGSFADGEIVWADGTTPCPRTRHLQPRKKTRRSLQPAARSPRC